MSAFCSGFNIFSVPFHRLFRRAGIGSPRSQIPRRTGVERQRQQMFFYAEHRSSYACLSYHFSLHGVNLRREHLLGKTAYSGIILRL